MKLKVNENGPTIVTTDIESIQIEYPDGRVENRTSTPTANQTIALCACGQSANKPYCDGTHKH